MGKELMVKIIGWTMFVLLLPIIFVGVVAFIVVDGAVFGWNTARNVLEKLYEG